MPIQLTIDELAAVTGSTGRSIRSFQTMGLLDPPHLEGRTGRYDDRHLERLQAILRLQSEGFALQSLRVLLSAHDRGASLGEVLGLPDPAPTRVGDGEADSAELYGFADLQPVSRHRHIRRTRPLLSVVPTTVWDETRAS